MGKSTRKKQEALAAQEEAVAQRLSGHRSRTGKVRLVVTVPGTMTETISRFHEHFLRPLHDWQYTGKSRKPEKQRLELVRYLFGKYPVPRFLEQTLASGDKEQAEFAGWYITAAQGGSLYKTRTRDVLSKKETHLLLQAPSTLTIKEAIWWAKTMAICGDIGVAYRMARCSIVRRGSYKIDFWIDVHRFFTNNPVTVKEMDELLDYILAEHRENNNWTIKKRSLEAIRRKSEEWHRAQYKMRNIGGGHWDGMDVPTWTMTTGKFDPNPSKNSKIEWTIRQILTGNALAREGQRMRHCVSSYKSSCMAGKTAIFSMTSSTPTQHDRRNLTIEVLPSARQLGQVRGYANRKAHHQEDEILYKWAMANRLNVNHW